MSWPKEHDAVWVALALDDVAMTLAVQTHAPGACFDRILPQADIGAIAPAGRDFKSQLQIEFDAFLYRIADKEPDPEPVVVDWLVSQWSLLADSPLAFRTRDGQLEVVASRDIPSRTHIKGLEDVVMLVGDEAAVDAQVAPYFTEWIKVGKTEQPFVWCGPFRLARRGCSTCSNTKWQKLKALDGFPPHTLRQALTSTKPIKKGDVISCNFGIDETRQCTCEANRKQGGRRTWASGGPGITTSPSPKSEKADSKRFHPYRRAVPHDRLASPASSVGSTNKTTHEMGATELLGAFMALLEAPPNPRSHISPERAESSFPSKSKIDDGQPALDASPVRVKKMRMCTGGRRPRPVPPLEPTPSVTPELTSSPTLSRPLDLLTPPHDDPSVEDGFDVQICGSSGASEMQLEASPDIEIKAGSDNAPFGGDIANNIPVVQKQPATTTKDVGVGTEPLPTQTNTVSTSPSESALVAGVGTNGEAQALSLMLSEGLKTRRQSHDESERVSLRARIADLKRRTAKLKAQNAELETHNAELVDRNVELVIRSRSLLAANRQLQRRISGDPVAEELSSVTEASCSEAVAPSPVHRCGAQDDTKTDLPVGLIIAKKYREETPWRRKSIEMIRLWSTQNAELREQNVRLQKKLTKQRAANMEGSKVLAREREKIKYLQAEKETLRITLAEKDAARVALAENEAMRAALSQQQDYVRSLAAYDAHTISPSVFTTAPMLRPRLIYGRVPQDSPHAITTAVAPLQMEPLTPALFANQPRVWNTKGSKVAAPIAQRSGLAPADLCSTATSPSIEIISVSSRATTPRPGTARLDSSAPATLRPPLSSPMAPFALHPSGLP